MTGPAIKLVEKSDNCKHWSALDAVDSAREAIARDGVSVKQAIVLWLEEDEKGNRTPRTCLAGLSREEEIAIVSVYLNKILMDFRRA